MLSCMKWLVYKYLKKKLPNVRYKKVISECKYFLAKRLLPALSSVYYYHSDMSIIKVKSLMSAADQPTP